MGTLSNISYLVLKTEKGGGKTSQARTSEKSDNEEKESLRRRFNLPPKAPVQIEEGVFDPKDFEPSSGWDRKSKGKGKAAPARFGHARKMR